MAAVFELEISPNEKLTLLALADHARDDGTGCYPSIETLARKTSQKRRGVQGIMRRLEKLRLIEPTGHVRGGRGMATEYRITLEKGAQGALFCPEKGRTGQQERAHLNAQKGAPGAPQPSLTILEPEGKTPRAKRAGDPRREPFIEFATRSFEARHGQAPAWTGRDFNALRELLRKLPDLSADELRRRWNNFEGSDEAYIATQRLSLYFFSTNLDRFIAGPVTARQNVKGGNGNGTKLDSATAENNIAGENFLVRANGVA